MNFTSANHDDAPRLTVPVPAANAPMGLWADFYAHLGMRVFLPR